MVDARGIEALTSAQWLPYVLVGGGLITGLFVVFVGPLPWPAVNFAVGGALLAVALGGASHLVVRGSGPGGRGPDF